MSKSTDNISSTCPLCFHPITIFAIGPCNHPICYICSTRMRVLVKQMYCAVCRGVIKQAIFTTKLHLYEGIITHRFPREREYGIVFEDNSVRLEFKKLLQHNCALCPDKLLMFKAFRELQEHVRKEHERFYCELCLKNTHVFTSERKNYPRKELALHRRKGDADDTSYRGHPLCEFCDERYFDNDILLKHLRLDHFYCHFCEADEISNQFFGDYPNLRDHFREDHYMCEEPECREEQFSHAFRTEIDLKAHRGQYHSKGFSKQQAKQNRQIEVDFQLPPRIRERERRDGAHYSGRGHAARVYRDESVTSRVIQASLLSEREERESRNRKQKNKLEEKQEEKLEEKREDKINEGHSSPVRVRRNRNVGGNGDNTEIQSNREERKEKVEVKAEEVNEPLPVAADFPTLAGAGKVQEPLQFTSWRNTPPAMDDFPTLVSAPKKQPPPSATSWGKSQFDPQDDYPVLPSSTRNAPNQVKSVNKVGAVPKAKVKKTHASASTNSWDTKLAVLDEDYPALPVSSKKGPSSNPIKNVKQNTPLENQGKQLPSQTVSSKSGPTNDYFNSQVLSSKTTDVAELSEKPKKPRGSAPPGFSSKEDFPSLSSIANLLGNNKPKSKAQAKKAAGKKKSSENGVPFVAWTENSPSKIKENSIASYNTPPPPGFQMSAPPPGFNKKIQPPPGFQERAELFVAPDNYRERNKELVHKIKKCLKHNPTGFEQFRDLSGQYRTNCISAQEYYDQCCDLLGENFSLIFSELVSLLPDIDKQQELLSVHNNRKICKAQAQSLEDVAVVKISKKVSSKKGAWISGSQPKHSVCPHCQQTILQKDYDIHVDKHQDFPALSASHSGRKAAIPIASSWGRLK